MDKKYMNRTRVSIILSSYNHAKYLKESIDSALKQIFRDFELVIWDDASTDNSWQIISDYSDPRIKSFRNEINMGGGNAKKAIEEVAQGEYIAIHHSDDIWELDKLEKQVAFLDSNPEIGAVFSQAKIIGENGEDFKDKNSFYYMIFDQPNRNRFEWLNYFFYQGNALCHPSVLIRKKCYDECGPYRLGMAQLPDFDMWVRLCLNYEIYVMPEKLVRYRIRDNRQNASTASFDARIRTNYELFQVYKNYLAIESPEDLKKIFPETESYFKPEGYDLGFILANAALSDKGVKIKSRELFGLDLLFSIFSDPIRTQKIKELYNFTSKDFTTLSAKYDVFNISTIIHNQLKIKEITTQFNEQKQNAQDFNKLLQEQKQISSDLRSLVNEYQQQAQILKSDMEFTRQELEETKKEAANYASSASWVITRPLRKIIKIFRRESNVSEKKKT